MVFNQEGQAKQDIIVAGIIALVSLHCGRVVLKRNV